jgi:hypothetical protein
MLQRISREGAFVYLQFFGALPVKLLLCDKEVNDGFRIRDQGEMDSHNNFIIWGTNRPIRLFPKECPH